MKHYQKLDIILKHLSNRNIIPRNPVDICKDAGLNVDDVEASLILDYISSEGLAYKILPKSNGIPVEHSPHYIGIYKAEIFLENGGFKLLFYQNKRKRIAIAISEYVDIIVKPIGILTAIAILIWTSIQIFNFIYTP